MPEFIQDRIFDGYALYCSENRPLGIISHDHERRAICRPESVPSKLKSYLVQIEDKRFYSHGAFDFWAIGRAVVKNVMAGSVVQGGSTITQQLARNLLKNNAKTINRKVHEARIALSLENRFSKDEILNQYFNNVYWGGQNFGLRSASLAYFNKEPQNLSSKEQLLLLTLLRGPNLYIRQNDLLDRRCKMICRVLRDRNIVSQRKLNIIARTEANILSRSLPVYKSASVPFISKDILRPTSTIKSTLDRGLQDDISRFINSSGYSNSVLVLHKGKIIGLGSSFGTDHPFVFKSNVGSTLKPFIYTILREQGIEPGQILPGLSSVRNWSIREVNGKSSVDMTIGDALVHSNNNVFVNASYMVDIDVVLKRLASVIGVSKDKLSPASILGASIDGLSLFQLVTAYERFFTNYQSDAFKSDCVDLLRQVSAEKFAGDVTGSFLKTGTTNSNSERFAIINYADAFFGFLRQGNEVDDRMKDGGFISSILSFLKRISNKVYKG